MGDHGLRVFDWDTVREDRLQPDTNLDNLIANWAEYREQLIIFLGAGASAGARSRSGRPIPAANALRQHLWERLMADDESAPSSMTLEHAAALIDSRKGREALIRETRAVFETDQEPWMHLAIPYLRPRAVFTTNYDLLIESGWQQARRKDASLPDLRPIFAAGQNVGGKVPLYKPHGSIDRAEDGVGSGGLVVTLIDYFVMNTTKRAMLSEWLREFRASCAIFVGYSFMDVDLGSLLFDMRQTNRDGSRDIPWYAVFPRHDPDVTRMYQEHFGIRQIDRTFFEFLLELEERIGFLPPHARYSSFVAETRASGSATR